MAEKNKQKVEMCCIVDTNEEPGGVIERGAEKIISFSEQPVYTYAAPSPVYPYLSVEQQIQLQIYSEMLRMQTDAKIESDRAKYENEKALEMFKQELKRQSEDKKQANRLQLLEARQAFQLQRAEMSSSVILDSADRFCREIRIPKKKRQLSDPIFDFTKPRIRRYFAVAGKKRFIVELSAEGLRDKILLADRELTVAKRIRQKLTNAGVIIHCPRRLVDLTLLQFAAFLILHAEDIELPIFKGWCHTSSGFVYTKDNTETIEGLLTEALEW